MCCSLAVETCCWTDPFHCVQKVKPAWSEILTEVLLITLVFWDVMVSGSDVCKDQSALTMMEPPASETLGTTHPITQHHIPEDLHTPVTSACTEQYNTVQYNAVQYNTVLHSLVQYGTIQYNTLQYSTVTHLLPLS
jgi:hypothetical protein